MLVRKKRRRLFIAVSRSRRSRKKQKEKSRRESFVSEMIKRFAYCIKKRIAEIDIIFLHGSVSSFQPLASKRAHSKGCPYSLYNFVCVSSFLPFLFFLSLLGDKKTDDIVEKMEPAKRVVSLTHTHTHTLPFLSYLQLVVVTSPESSPLIELLFGLLLQLLQLINCSSQFAWLIHPLSPTPLPHFLLTLLTLSIVPSLAPVSTLSPAPSPPSPTSASSFSQAAGATPKWSVCRWRNCLWWQDSLRLVSEWSCWHSLSCWLGGLIGDVHLLVDRWMPSLAHTALLPSRHLHPHFIANRSAWWASSGGRCSSHASLPPHLPPSFH